jgi:hypothetical protein
MLLATAWVVALCAACCFVLGDENTVGQPPAGVQAIPAVALTPVRSGAFSVALPQGWSVTPSPGGDSVQMSPVGENQPSAYMAIVSISDLRYQAMAAACEGEVSPYANPLMQCVIPSVQMQLEDSKRQWGPREAFQLFLQLFQEAGGGAEQFGAPMLIPGQPLQAFYQVLGTGSDGPTENWGIVTMSVLANPLLGRGEVTSLATIAGCSAPAERAESFRRTCAGIINSLRPSQDWEGRLAARIADVYAGEVRILIRLGRITVLGPAARQQMIARLGQSMDAMRLQTFQSIQSADYRNQQGWIATFAGNRLITDPATGHLFSVPSGYKSYGIDDRQFVPVVVCGNNVQPGTSVGTATVQRLLP